MGIVIVNAGMGNIMSISNMLRKVGAEHRVSSSPNELATADKVILPGIGAFDRGVDKLERLGFFDELNEHVLIRQRPILGICLGMQLLLTKSAEGVRAGFGWIAGEVVRFDLVDMVNQQLKVPHMGWSEVRRERDSKLFNGWEGEARFYFVHSYHAVCDDSSNVSSHCRYGHEFTASVEKDNVFGVQFHPEKSHRFGMKLLKTFVEI